MRNLGLLCATSALILFRPAAALEYDVRVGIRPDLHRLDATVTIRDPISERFSLYKNFSIQSVTADGKPVGFHIDPSAKPSPFAPETVVVVVEASKPQILEVRYGGTIDVPVSGVNMITSALVELSGTSGWYPFYSLSRDYTFRLTAVLPQGLTVGANAKTVSQSTRDGRTTTVFTSYEPTFDIALVAAPGMQSTVGGSPRVEVDYATMAPATMDKLRDGLIEARRRLIAHYGAPQTRTGLQVFYGPREGYPYSRPPLVLTSEGYVANDLKSDNPDAALFHWAAHELAHYWWYIARAVNDADWTDNCDNWLNEGLAEFSALRLVEEQYGTAAARKILDQYRLHATHNKTGDAIAETRQSSPDQWLNRYERTPLMFFAARERFGDRKLDALLSALHARFAGTRAATTAAFLDLARQHLGEEGAAFFREELYRKPPVPASR